MNLTVICISLMSVIKHPFICLSFFFYELCFPVFSWVIDLFADILWKEVFLYHRQYSLALTSVFLDKFSFFFLCHIYRFLYFINSFFCLLDSVSDFQRVFPTMKFKIFVSCFLLVFLRFHSI